MAREIAYSVERGAWSNPVGTLRRSLRRLATTAVCGARHAIRSTLYAIPLSVALATPSAAQLAPDAHWETLRTRHFYIHFTPPLEHMARRAAVSAETAYAQLASELVPPRGPVDLVISDDADESNGWATPFPTNRIVIYANPPVEESALRFTDDWTAMVITHELTHIFHLDRARGVWWLGQKIFGRASYIFPNEYAPSWLTEGLAVYYESRFTGAGRITGSEHRMIARASAVDHVTPRLGDVSLASPRFPFGEAAYAYGSLFVDYLAKTRGESRVRDFVEKESAELVPYWLNLPAKGAFGISFSRAWRDWRDSLVRSIGPDRDPPLTDWRTLTRDGVFVGFPRWLGDSAILYSGTPGRESHGAYRVDLDGRRTRLGRRNSDSPQNPLPDGSLLYAQLDFTSPYQLRSDLYVQHRRGGEERLTHAARLAAPDVRADGAIIAVQVIPGGTRLVRVSPDGRSIVPLTGGGLDETWAEPRWSHRGDRIAAIRWRRGGISEVVVLDSSGSAPRVVVGGHAVQATPSWTSDDRGLLYSSDRTGSAQLYLAMLDERAADGAGVHEYRLSNVITGLFEPELSPAAAQGSITASDSGTRAPIPDTRRLASVLFRSDGYHLGVGACCDLDQTPTALSVSPIAATSMQPVSAVALEDSAPIHEYSPWRSLLPRYWLPTTVDGLRGTRLGVQTSGSDVVGRHAYSVDAAVPQANTGMVWDLAYEYAGLGLPILDLYADQSWSYAGPVTNSAGAVLAELDHRSRQGEVTATWLRPRVRRSVSLTAGVGVEQSRYAVVPDVALQNPSALAPATYPSLIAAFGLATAQRPPFSISQEDGITLGGTARERWRTSGSSRSALSLVGAGGAFKSLDLPGFAHHVLALRGAAGAAGIDNPGYLDVGGTSGTPVTLIAEYTLGEGRRTFGVRGFDAGSLLGDRALTGSIEYRAPLVQAGRGLGLLPLFFDRSSLTLFYDAGSAWCSRIVADGNLCTTDAENALQLSAHRWIASTGAELDLTAAVLSWDAPYQFRVGVVHPVHIDVLFGNPRSVSWYFATGVSF